jgi:putative ATP-dependent endonuclease of OLD family
MKLTSLRLSGFMCFGAEPTTISLEAQTFLLGPNGTGKTAVLLALVRLFGADPSHRRIRPSDFHASASATGKAETELWIEATFEFPELRDEQGKYATVPANFAHMQLETADSVPRVCFRLSAKIDDDGEIDERFQYVLARSPAGEPSRVVDVTKANRKEIVVHYVPARRDPADQISYGTRTLLGRALRAVDWNTDGEKIASLGKEITDAIGTNEAVSLIEGELSKEWSSLHNGKYYTAPTISFGADDLEGLLERLTVRFSPAETEDAVDFQRLSDGQKSLLYISVILGIQRIARLALAGTTKLFDLSKMRPAVFTILAIEEPENSLSPYYLGRVLRQLTAFSQENDGQVLVATHSPALVRRAPPEQIRHLRLDDKRRSIVSSITMPTESDEAYKFVREAVLAYPELYFARLVILGEGDSEEVVLPRILSARGILEDDRSIAVAPLGGRHVNHFWRLLTSLDIPYVTLLDLDVARFQGGWGRIRNVLNQLRAHGRIEESASFKAVPKWNDADNVLSSNKGMATRKFLEEKHGVFFSEPLDLDLAMLEAFPAAYGVQTETADAQTLAAVLGKKHGDEAQLSDKQRSLFTTYHHSFKLGSKPASHLRALSQLDDDAILAAMPASLKRLLDAVEVLLKGLPE